MMRAEKVLFSLGINARSLDLRRISPPTGCAGNVEVLHPSTAGGNRAVPCNHSHRRKVRLLVSGVAPFEELGSLWNGHFINVRELRIGHLDEATSIELLCNPIPEFLPNAVPPGVARLIFERTGGQPYLLQLFGSLLINRLNEEKRMMAAKAISRD